MNIPDAPEGRSLEQAMEQADAYVGQFLDIANSIANKSDGDQFFFDMSVLSSATIQALATMLAIFPTEYIAAAITMLLEETKREKKKFEAHRADMAAEEAIEKAKGN